MDRKPLISIITINFNDKVGLERTFESVFNQTFKDFEYIVIDGGSKDGSKDLIEKNAEKINYWVSEPDKGIYNAMNKGILKATGDYVLFLNGGDYLFNNTVLSEVESYLNKEKDIVYGKMLVNTKAGKSWEFESPDKLELSHCIKLAIPHQATFILKSLFEKVGFYDEKYRIISDWAFIIKSIFIHQATYLKINQTISIFNLDGISADPKEQKNIQEERNSFCTLEIPNLYEEAKETNNLKLKVKLYENDPFITFFIKIRKKFLK